MKGLIIKVLLSFTLVLISQCAFSGDVHSFSITKTRSSQFKGQSVSFALSPDGSLLATAAYPAKVGFKLWSVRTGRLMASLGTGKAYSVMAFSHDGQTLAVSEDAESRDKISLWNVRAKRLLKTLPSPSWNHIASLVFSADNKWIATGGYDPSVVSLWDVKRGRILARFGSLYFLGSVRIALSQDGHFLAATTGTYKEGGFSDIIVWNVRTRKAMFRLQTPDKDGFNPEGAVMTLAFLGKKNILMAAGTKISLRNPVSGKVLSLLPVDSANATASKSGTLLYIVSSSALTIYEVRRRKTLAEYHFAEPFPYIDFIQCSENGNICATLDQKNVLTLWRIHHP